MGLVMYLLSILVAQATAEAAYTAEVAARTAAVRMAVAAHTARATVEAAYTAEVEAHTAEESSADRDKPTRGLLAAMF